MSSATSIVVYIQSFHTTSVVIDTASTRKKKKAAKSDRREMLPARIIKVRATTNDIIVIANDKYEAVELSMALKEMDMCIEKAIIINIGTKYIDFVSIFICFFLSEFFYL